MIDENAFGVLVSWYDIEDAEYGMEPDEFAERWREFVAAWHEALEVFRLGDGAEALDLGHALYVEIADGDQAEDPIVWLKMVRARIAEKGFTTVGIVSHGGRWREELPSEVKCAIPVTVGARPSEAFRRALFAETATHEDEELAPDGWGPGIYVDSEAIEALGRQLKNAPTPLASGGATFFRVAR
jgi:hypothetical protein